MCKGPEVELSRPEYHQGACGWTGMIPLSDGGCGQGYIRVTSGTGRLQGALTTQLMLGWLGSRGV